MPQDQAPPKRIKKGRDHLLIWTLVPPLFPTEGAQWFDSQWATVHARGGNLRRVNLASVCCGFAGEDGVLLFTITERK